MLIHWLKLTRLEEPSTPMWLELSLEFSLWLTWDTLQCNALQFHLIKKLWLSPVLMARSKTSSRVSMDLDLEQLLTTLKREMLALEVMSSIKTMNAAVNWINRLSKTSSIIIASTRNLVNLIFKSQHFLEHLSSQMMERVMTRDHTFSFSTLVSKMRRTKLPSMIKLLLLPLSLCSLLSSTSLLFTIFKRWVD